MNRLIPRSWGENFVNIFLDLSKYISHFSSSTCVDRQFLTHRHSAPWLPFPPLPRRHRMRISPPTSCHAHTSRLVCKPSHPRPGMVHRGSDVARLRQPSRVNQNGSSRGRQRSNFRTVLPSLTETMRPRK